MTPSPAPSATAKASRPPGRPEIADLATDPDLATKVIGTMWRIRLFEEAVDELFARGLMHGTMHLSIGQEASATGACLALRDDDAITSTHRGHGHCIGQGRRPEPDDGRAAGEGDRLLPRPRRLDAHRRRRHRQPRRQRHRRRRHPDRRRRRAAPTSCRAAGPRRRQLLRRRRHQRGRLPRGGQPGRDLEAARRLRLREQQVRHVVLHREVDGDRRPRRARRRRTASRASASTATTWQAVYEAVGHAAVAARPRRRRTRRSSRRSPTGGRATASPTRTSTAPARRSPSGGSKDPIAAFRARGPRARCPQPRTDSQAIRAGGHGGHPRRRPRRATPPPTPTPTTCSTAVFAPPEEPR